MRSLLLTVVVLVSAGCGSGPATDPKVESARLDASQQQRQLFDKSNGSYDSLSAEDKAAALKLFNGKEEDARRAWSEMGARSAGPRSSAAGTPTAGPQ